MKLREVYIIVVTEVILIQYLIIGLIFLNGQIVVGRSFCSMTGKRSPLLKSYFSISKDSPDPLMHGRCRDWCCTTVPTGMLVDG